MINRVVFFITLITLIIIEPVVACLSQDYSHLSRHCRPENNYEQIFRVVFGEDSKPRQIAVVAGVSEYPNLPESDRKLEPSANDIEMLTDALQNKLEFDEIIVLENQYFNSNNLEYIFKVYLPSQFEKHKKSRVLFAFSGHGDDFKDSGYLFLPKTKTITINSYEDTQDAIDLDSIKVILKPTIATSHQFLALINSCNGGHFLSENVTFGSKTLEEAGVHAITAGRKGENVYARSREEGSIFFELIVSALLDEELKLDDGTELGNAARDDGILTAYELATFVKSGVNRMHDYKVSPQIGRLTRNHLEGEFFFITNFEKSKKALESSYPEQFKKVFGDIPEPFTPTERESFKISLNSDLSFEKLNIYSPKSRLRQLSRSVGRLDVRFPSGKFLSCTTTLIAESLILTAAHCIPGIGDHGVVTEANLIMGYYDEVDHSSAKSYEVNVSPLESSRSLDYSILHVNGNPGREWDVIKTFAEIKEAGSPLIVIHHPGGAPKHVTRSWCHSGVPKPTEHNDLLHTCGTIPGSSGAPIFSDDSGALVAMHYAGRLKADPGFYNYGKLMSSIISQSAIFKTLKLREASSSSFR